MTNTHCINYGVLQNCVVWARSDIKTFIKKKILDAGGLGKKTALTISFQFFLFFKDFTKALSQFSLEKAVWIILKNKVYTIIRRQRKKDYTKLYQY